jgi:hypothetical protein
VFNKKNKDAEIPTRPPEKAPIHGEVHNPPVDEAHFKGAMKHKAPDKDEYTGWKEGPVPNGTFNWGFVVPVGEAGNFYFADFRGDHVELANGRTLMPDKVAFYNNCLTAPPGTPEGAMRTA